MFENLTPEKAYFLGFFSADGCNENFTLSIQLQIKDEYILKYFEQLFIKEGYNTTFSSASRTIVCSDGLEHKYSRLRIYGKDLCDELTLLGLHPNKSFTLSMPNIPDYLMPDYLRGLFDGDGTINNRRNNLELEIYSANEQFLYQVINWLKNNTDIKIPNINKRANKNVYRFSLYSNQTIKFCNLIYGTNCGLYLARKKDKFLNFSPTRDPKYWSIDDVQYVKDNYMPSVRGLVSKIAKDLNRSPKAVSKIIWTYNLGA